MHKSSTRVGHLILASHASCPGPGSSGFGFHTADKAELGYILSGLAWGQGFATETVNALVTVAASFGLLELDAHVHPANAASIRVLQKCGLTPDGAPIQARFPNSGDTGQVNAIRFRRSLGYCGAVAQVAPDKAAESHSNDARARMLA